MCSQAKKQFKRISNNYIPIESIESQWRSKELEEFLNENYGLATNINALIKEDTKLLPESIAELIISKADEMYKEKYSPLAENRLLLEKQVPWTAMASDTPYQREFPI